MPSKSKLEFRHLGADDVEQFREIRLEALQRHPEAFLGCHSVESQKPLEFFHEAMNHDKVIGCFREGKLLGIAGYYVITPEGKRAHSAKLWGFYVRPEYRGRGFAKRLFQKILDEVELVAEKALLKVNRKSRNAIKLYRSLGFIAYGMERKSLKIDGKYYDDLLMEKLF